MAWQRQRLSVRMARGNSGVAAAALICALWASAVASSELAQAVRGTASSRDAEKLGAHVNRSATFSGSGPEGFVDYEVRRDASVH